MKRLEKYLKKREESINFLLKKQRHLYTPNTYHNLRVEIKKLNALLDLVNYSSPEFKRKKTLKPLKEIFRQAGKVRDIQIEEAMLKKYFDTNLLKEYRSGLRKLRLNEQVTYFSIVNKNKLTQLNKTYRVIRSFNNNVTKKKAIEYLDQKSKEIAKLLNQNHLLKAQAHELRKRLKTFNYNQKILTSNKESKLQQIDIITELLGKWNDGQVTIRNLKKAISDGTINTSELDQLKKIKSQISSENEKLFNEIKHHIVGV